jgi:predicted nucleic acid-binding protein
MIVLDASVLAAALGEDAEAGTRLRDRLWVDNAVFAPELIDLEVAAYARRLVRLGQMLPERAVLLLADLAVMPLRRVSHVPFLGRIWELRDNVSSYDAAYVALAETMEAPLLTTDARLARAPGIRCDVHVLA